MTKETGNEVWYDTKTEHTDTVVVDAKDSPISDYVNGNFKAERLSVTIPLIDNNTQNMIRSTTDDRNPRVPQVVMID